MTVTVRHLHSAAAAIAAEALAKAGQPLFYRDPHPVSPQRHAGLSLTGTGGYRFAAGAVAVPLNADEFEAALPFYPIVFTAGDPVIALAMVGLEQGRNLFVTSAGAWRRGVYVPNYVERYPFLLRPAHTKRQLVLCVDEASPHVGEGGDRPLFHAGDPTEATAGALERCIRYERGAALTRRFVDALLDADVLVPGKWHRHAEAGPAPQIRYQVVSETKLAAVPGKTIAAWHKEGFLRPLHAHLFSARNWDALVRRATRGVGGGSS